MIKNNCVLLRQSAKDWQSAVKIGCDLLEEQHIVSSQYYSGILESTAKYGPYYVLAPGVAMPHAPSEFGALKLGFSLTTLEHPVNFGSSENDPVDLLITFAAANRQQMNGEAIVQVMELLEDEAALNKIRAARTVEDL